MSFHCQGNKILQAVAKKKFLIKIVQFSSVQSLSRVRLFVTPWITARQASLSITNSRSSPRLMSIESVMPSSHLILCCPLLLLPPIPPSIRVFSNESTLHMRWPTYWSFSFSIIPSKEHPGLISDAYFYSFMYAIKLQKNFYCPSLWKIIHSYWSRLGYIICFDQGNVGENDMCLSSRGSSLFLFPLLWDYHNLLNFSTCVQRYSWSQHMTNM